MRGGGCLTAASTTTGGRQLSYLPPQRQLEAAGVLPAASLPGCEAAVDIPASVKITGGGSRPTCRRQLSAAVVALLAASP